MKAFPAEALTHTPISAVLDLVNEYDLHPDQVRRVRIRSLARAADILADPSKYDPRSKESADHSLPYVIAAALVDRAVTPAQFTQDRIMSEDIRSQLSKVEVVADPAIEAVFPGLQRVIVTIETTAGTELTKQLDYPKGDPRNPLTDAEIEQKFDALAEPVMSLSARERLKDAVWDLENAASISGVMALAAADKRVHHEMHA
jgi:2-methylcitrate dehydratase